MDELDEDEELIRKTKENLLSLSRLHRRKLLQDGDTSAQEESPLDRIHQRFTFAAAENQEYAEQKFGEDYVREHQFTKGAFKWLVEPDPEQRIFILLGVMMSISDAQTMIDLINDLGMDAEPFMEFAHSQIKHIKDHQQTCSEAMARADVELTPEEVLKGVEDILGDKEVDIDKD